jgi:hypothetical protein
MGRFKLIKVSLFLSLLILLASSVVAAPTPVTVDISSLGSSVNVELEISLYDNSGTVGDSYVVIDNVILGTDIDDFDDGTLGGFNESMNPASVGVVSQMMRIDEDSFTPTIVYRDYFPATGSVLSFDFECFLSDVSGPFGQDELVVSLLDPDTLDPLVTGLTPGYGDILIISASGIQAHDIVELTIVPVPGAAALCGLGLGIGSLIRRRL